MKSLLFAISLFIAIQYVNSQGCLPEGIQFTAQEQVDNFQNDYPDCTEIEGDLTIAGEDITNLNGLSVLTKVVGSLKVGTIFSPNPSLENLSGLHNISEVGWDVSIVDNELLTDLTGLGSLQTIGAKLIIGLPGHGNPALENLNGLISLQTITTALHVSNNSSLISLEGMYNLLFIGSGGVSVSNNDALINLKGLGGLTTIGSIGISHNEALQTLQGLQNITEVDGSLIIEFCSGLESFSMLSALEYIWGDFTIQNNNLLSDLQGLENLVYIGNNFDVLNNGSLTSMIGLGNILVTSISGKLTITGNPLLTYCHVEGICNYFDSPNFNAEINNNCPGCNSVVEVTVACTVFIDKTFETEIFTVSPNPSTGMIRLNLFDNDQEYISCNLYNISGTVVKNLLNESQNINESGTEINISDIPDGVYYCVFRNSIGILTKKLIKL